MIWESTCNLYGKAYNSSQKYCCVIDLETPGCLQASRGKTLLLFPWNRRIAAFCSSIIWLPPFPTPSNWSPSERYWVTKRRNESWLGADLLYFVRKQRWTAVSPWPSMLHITYWAFSAFEKSWGATDMSDDILRGVFARRKNKYAPFILLCETVLPEKIAVWLWVSDATTI